MWLATVQCVIVSNLSKFLGSFAVIVFQFMLLRIQQSVCLSASCLLINSFMIAFANRVQEVRTPRKTTFDTNSCVLPKTKNFFYIISSFLFQFTCDSCEKWQMSFRCRSVIRKIFIGAKPFLPTRIVRLFLFARTPRNSRQIFCPSQHKINLLNIFQLALHRLYYSGANTSEHSVKRWTWPITLVRSSDRQTDSVQSLLCHIRCVRVCVCHAVSHTTQNNLYVVHTFHEKSKFEATVRCTLDVDKE